LVITFLASHGFDLVEGIGTPTLNTQVDTQVDSFRIFTWKRGLLGILFRGTVLSGVLVRVVMESEFVVSNDVTRMIHGTVATGKCSTEQAIAII
jgi:hypothetical protein